MKIKEVAYLNDKHKKIIEKLTRDVKKYVYFATDDFNAEKYKDFIEILDSVFVYSNNFHDITYRVDKENGVMAEFLFIIPNTLFYTAIGFLIALRNEKNEHIIYKYLQKISGCCENATSELTDVLIDEKEKRNIKKTILQNTL
tara:strand:- start:1363 stop:1791 length:429 start_codon:yes stop_codon:yes gene_type:complete